ncbi:hypothetical protein HMPREF9012_0804 [Bacteroidetes bacterium oral taxon 272 str. F0290]|nr:hypothetical protein HMPREF9012_0804 [Bacteroidetes bacterium oral taxon 272 str. F0290]
MGFDCKDNTILLIPHANEIKRKGKTDFWERKKDSRNGSSSASSAWKPTASVSAPPFHAYKKLLT